MHVAPGERQRNLESAIRFIHEAARGGAEVVLLPEALPFGWMHPAAQDGADGIPDGEVCELFSKAARDAKISVCAGLVERDGTRLFNSAVLISPKGELLLHHRKINELEIAHQFYALGDRIAVAETSLGRIGLMICADGFAPGQAISRSLALMGAQVILSPCAWAVPPEHDNAITPYGKLWIDNYAPVTREFGIWIAGCSNVGPINSGPWRGHRCIGASLVVGPAETIRFQGSYGESAEELSWVELDLIEPCRPTGRDAGDS